jgi:hypothetical protein
MPYERSPNYNGKEGEKVFKSAELKANKGAEQ